MKRFVGPVSLFTVLASVAFAAPPMGDTQGRVESVAVDHNYQRDYNSFLIYMRSVENDRWGCLATDGYIRVKDNGVGVTPDNFKQIFSLAVAAQVAGKRLALSSAGSNPCVNVNGAWMLD
jgi:hypothetical protein